MLVMTGRKVLSVAVGVLDWIMVCSECDFLHTLGVCAAARGAVVLNHAVRMAVEQVLLSK